MINKLVKIREKAFDNIDVSININSKVYDIRDATGYSTHSYWNGTSGTVQVTTEGSNDQETFEGRANNWAQIETQVLTGSSGSRLLNVEIANYCFIRFVLTQTSGIGNLTLIISSK